MNEEKLLEAMGCIDDSLIEEAEKVRSRKKRRFPVAKVGLIAACLLLVLAGTVLVYPHFSKDAVGNDGYTADNENNGIPTAPTAKESFTADEEPMADADKDSANKSTSIIEEEAYAATDSSLSYVPMLLTVESFTDSGFVCTVYDSGGSDTFSDGDRLTVIYSSDLQVPETLCEGDRVYVTYGIDNENEDTVYAYKIAYETGDTTPAYYGGKQ